MKHIQVCLNCENKFYFPSRKRNSTYGGRSLQLCNGPQGIKVCDCGLYKHQLFRHPTIPIFNELTDKTKDVFLGMLVQNDVEFELQQGYNCPYRVQHEIISLNKGEQK